MLLSELNIKYDELHQELFAKVVAQLPYPNSLQQPQNLQNLILVLQQAERKPSKKIEEEFAFDVVARNRFQRLVL